MLMPKFYIFNYEGFCFVTCCVLVNTKRCLGLNSMFEWRYFRFSLHIEAESRWTWIRCNLVVHQKCCVQCASNLSVECVVCQVYFGEFKVMTCLYVYVVSISVWCIPNQSFLLSFQPTRDELVKLSSSFADQANLAMSGVHIGGEKFFYLSGTDKVSLTNYIAYQGVQGRHG